MLDTKDFNFLENSNFDFQSFLNKLVSYWKWLIVSFIITFTVAYQVNIRKQKIYSLNTVISIKDENNPFFTSNTSLVFNWGGVSEKLFSFVNTLKSRTYNELVIDKLEFYVQYFKQGEYYLIDAYGEAPFKVVLNKDRGQLANEMISVTILNDKEYQLKYTLPDGKTDLYRYSDKSSIPYYY
jgi:succinoglycan biosynthesis transport protein ExoP